MASTSNTTATNTAIDTAAARATSKNEQDPAAMLLDGLPYVDPVNDDYEQYALALIEEEMTKSTSTAHDHLTEERGPPAFRTNIIEREYRKYESISRNGNPTKAPDFCSQLLRPPDASADDDDERTVELWTDAVRGAKIRYELERIRASVLEVERDGPASSAVLWQQYNALLEENAALLRQALSAQRAAVEDINYSRQQEQQQKYGPELSVLTSQYHDLVRKLFSLKTAVYELEQEVLAQSAGRSTDAS